MSQFFSRLRRRVASGPLLPGLRARAILPLREIVFKSLLPRGRKLGDGGIKVAEFFPALSNDRLDPLPEFRKPPGDRPENIPRFFRIQKRKALASFSCGFFPAVGAGFVKHPKRIKDTVN